MKAVRYHGPRQPFRFEEVAEPDPGPGQVKVRIRAAGMCHTELHFESGLLDLGVAPVTLGHEIAGEVHSVGSGAAARRPGERVVLSYYAGCGGCEWCRRGEENLCEQLDMELGFLHDGGWAEYVCVPERNAVPLPDAISFRRAAPIGCGVTTALHACRLAGVREGEAVAVYGIGAVGYGLLQVAKLRGARVAAIGRSPAKLERARELGADLVIAAPEAAAAASQVRAWSGGRGADVVFELVATRATMEACAAMLARRGRLVFVGYSPDVFTIHPIRLVIQEAIVTASVGSTLADLEEAVRLVATGAVQTLVDRVLPLECWSEGLEALRRGEVVGRVILEP